MQYLYNPPLPVKYLFSRSIWNTGNNKVLLTFDDGPLNGNTDLILKKLDDNNIKALFFCVGNNILSNPGLTEELLKEGHSVGNHTMNHKILSNAGESIIAGEIKLFNEHMEEKFGYKVKYFRPPHGRMSFKLRSYLQKQELENVMWSLLTYDYKNDIQKVKRSYKYLRSNSIVILHDSIKSKNIISDSIDLLMDNILLRDYKTGTPEECLR
jgi:peptidoglycan-N-acetylglucosamine deacetylase